MKVLIGTTNPSKIKRFSDMLKGYDVELLTLDDLQISESPDEVGKTPKENAEIKAKFYGQFCDKVICNDSGLYFDELPLEDVRQPGLHIRTPEGKRLGDEEMITYYSSLVKTLGGKVLSFYLDGIATYSDGNISGFMENSEASKASSFYMVSDVHPKRHEGWPLDSISINRNTNAYFVDQGNNKYDTLKENIILGQYRKRLIQFLVDSLHLKSRVQ